MSMHVTDGAPPTPSGDDRSALLTSLASAVRSRGGVALLALPDTAHPVLYVRHRGRAVAVVLVQGITGGWWFIWGRTAAVPASWVEVAADQLAGSPPPHTNPGTDPRPWRSGRQEPRSWRRPNLVAERRAALKEVA